MSRGESSAGVFIGSGSAINGDGELGPAISGYHKKKAGEVVFLKPSESYKISGLDLVATPAKHSDPTTIGFKIQTDSGLIGYTSDTEYFDELLEVFEDVRFLVANVTRPGGKSIDGHLCSDDLVKILKEVKPELSVMLHMGMLFLRNSPEKEARYVEEESGVRTISGHVGTRVNMGEDVRVEFGKKQTDIRNFS